MLTLAQALKKGKLREFIAQEEARGIGPVERKELEATIEKATTTLLKSKGRTSYADLLAHMPRRFVRYAERALQFLATHAVARGHKQVDRVEPDLQRRSGIWKIVPAVG